MAHGVPDKDVNTPENGTKAPAETPQGSDDVRAQTKEGAVAALETREKAEVPKALGRLFCVRHGKTASNFAPANMALDAGEDKKAEAIGKELWAAGVRPGKCVIRYDARAGDKRAGGKMVRVIQTAEAILEGLNCAAEAAGCEERFTDVRSEEELLDTTDKNDPSWAARTVDTTHDSLTFAEGFIPGVNGEKPKETTLAGGKDEVWVIHKSNWEGVCKLFLNEKGDHTTNPALGIKPLEIKEIDYPADCGRKNPGLRHDEEGLLYLRTKGLADFVAAADKALGAVPEKTPGRKEALGALEKWAQGGVRIADLQNQLNGILIGNPELAKALAGCGVPELDLMALRAAMGAKPFETGKADFQAAKIALLELATTEPSMLARTGVIFAGAAWAPIWLAAELAPELRESKEDGPRITPVLFKDAAKTNQGKEKAALESFALALETATSTDRTFGKSIDARISGKTHGSDNPNNWPLGGNYRPKFHILGIEGNDIFNNTKGAGVGNPELLTALAGDRAGVTVVEADGGSGKSLLLAEAVLGHLRSEKTNDLGNVAYVNLASASINDDGVVEVVKSAATIADTLVLDSLDEADWSGHTKTDLDKKRFQFASFLEKLAGDEKKIILTTREGHWSGKGRKLRLPAFDTDRANAYVQEYLTGHAFENRLLSGWGSLRDAAKNDDALAEIVGNPLTLLLLCEVVAGGEAYDEVKNFSWYAKNLGRLFEEATKMRLAKWESRKNRTLLSASDRRTGTEALGSPRIAALMDGLAQIAYLIGSGKNITEADVADFLPDASLDRLDFLDRDGASRLDVGPLGFLIQRDAQGKITFSHERIREYFAVRHGRKMIELGFYACLEILPEAENFTLDDAPAFGNANIYTAWKGEITRKIFSHERDDRGFSERMKTRFAREVVREAKKTGVNYVRICSLLKDAAKSKAAWAAQEIEQLTRAIVGEIRADIPFHLKNSRYIVDGNRRQDEPIPQDDKERRFQEKCERGRILGIKDVPTTLLSLMAKHCGPEAVKWSVDVAEEGLRDGWLDEGHRLEVLSGAAKSKNGGAKLAMDHLLRLTPKFRVADSKKYASHDPWVIMRKDAHEEEYYRALFDAAAGCGNQSVVAEALHKLKTLMVSSDLKSSLYLRATNSSPDVCWEIAKIALELGFTDTGDGNPLFSAAKHGGSEVAKKICQALEAKGLDAFWIEWEGTRHEDPKIVLADLEKQAEDARHGIIDRDWLGTILKAMAEFCGPEAAKRAIAEAAEEVRTGKMEKEYFSQFLWGAMRYNGVAVAHEAVHAADGLDFNEDEFASIMMTAQVHGRCHTVNGWYRRLLTRFATSKKLYPWMVWSMQDMRPQESLTAFLSLKIPLSSEEVLNVVDKCLGNWIAHHGVALSSYVYLHHSKPVKRDAFFGILSRFPLKDKAHHKKLIALLQGLRFDEPAPSEKTNKT